MAERREQHQLEWILGIDRRRLVVREPRSPCRQAIVIIEMQHPGHGSVHRAIELRSLANTGCTFKVQKTATVFVEVLGLELRLGEELREGHVAELAHIVD
jgi:hypothetical protein